MTEQEKKILEMMDQATKNVTVPENLQPDNIQKMLEEKYSDLPTAEKKSSKITSHKWGRYVALAAVAALVVGIGIASTNRQKTSSDSNSSSKEEFQMENTIASASDYEEVFDYIKSYQDEIAKTYDSGFFNFGAKGEAAVADSAAGAKTSSTQMDTKQEAVATYSDTNVRTEGVGEADVVKTDGTYLYALKESAMEITIIDALNDEMKEIATIKAIDNMQIAEFYVNGDQLFVLGNVSKTKLDADGNELYYGEDTVMVSYDISDIEHPKLTETVSQSGHYQTSRFTNGYLYVFSDFYIYDTCKKSDREIYLPKVNNTFIAETDIYLPPAHAANQYVVVSSINAEKPGEVADQKAVLAENGACYVSGDNIYIYENTRNSVLLRTTLANVNETLIRKISYKDGKLKGESQGKVKGSLNDSFSIDEYDGNLRVVTTIYGSQATTNAVYVLDNELKIIGRIEDLAKNEQVYSARFFGNIGYFVTFRQTDPLFSVDFTDPKNPQIIGTLKIPGFSEYLHFYGENLLLGIGMDTDESGTTNGVKVSMFDISNPADVKEVHKYTVKEAYYSDIFNDYRAVLVDYDKNMIGFSAYGSIEYYYIFSYDETNGFNVEMEEEVNGMSYMGTRGIYVGDKLFVIKGNAVESYRIGNYEKVDDILL